MEFKVELDKELQKEKEKSVEEFGNIPNETQLLLMEGADQEKEALRVANLHHDLREAESKRGIEIDRKKNEEEYKGSVFTYDEIKSLCLKYDLRCLPSKIFRGKLDNVLAGKLKDFIKAHKGMGASSDAFYVIADEKCFDLDGRKATRKKATDPILLYRTPKDDNFVLIHNWGEGSNILRRVRGMYMESLASMHTYGTIFFSFIVAMVFILNFDKFTGEWFQYLNLLWIFGLGFLLNIGILALWFNEAEDFDERANDYLWNSKDRRRR